MAAVGEIECEPGNRGAILKSDLGADVDQMMSSRVILGADCQGRSTGEVISVEEVREPLAI